MMRCCSLFRRVCTNRVTKLSLDSFRFTGRGQFTGGMQMSWVLWSPKLMFRNSLSSSRQISCSSFCSPASKEVLLTVIGKPRWLATRIPGMMRKLYSEFQLSLWMRASSLWRKSPLRMLLNQSMTFSSLDFCFRQRSLGISLATSITASLWMTNSVLLFFELKGTASTNHPGVSASFSGLSRSTWLYSPSLSPKVTQSTIQGGRRSSCLTLRVNLLMEQASEYLKQRGRLTSLTMPYLPTRSMRQTPSVQVTLMARRESISIPLESTKVMGLMQWLSLSQRRKDAVTARAEQHWLIRQIFSCTFSYLSISSKEWWQDVFCGMQIAFTSGSPKPSASNMSRCFCFLPQSISTMAALPSRLATLSMKLYSTLCWKLGDWQYSNTFSSMSCLVDSISSGPISSSSLLSSFASSPWICCRSFISLRQSIRHSWDRMTYISSRSSSTCLLPVRLTILSSRGSTMGSQSLRARLRCQTERCTEFISPSLVKKSGRNLTDSSGFLSPHSQISSSSSTRMLKRFSECTATLPFSSGWLNSVSTKATASNLLVLRKRWIFLSSQTRNMISLLLSLSLKLVMQRFTVSPPHLTIPLFSTREMHSLLNQNRVSFQEKRPFSSYRSRMLTPRFSPLVTLISMRTSPILPLRTRLRWTTSPACCFCFSSLYSSLAIFLFLMDLMTSLMMRLPSPLTTSQMMVCRSTCALMESTSTEISLGVKESAMMGSSIMLKSRMPLNSAVRLGWGSLRFLEISILRNESRLRYLRIQPSTLAMSTITLNYSRNLLMLSARLCWLRMLASRFSSSSMGTTGVLGAWDCRARTSSWYSEEIAMILEKVENSCTQQLSLLTSKFTILDCNDSQLPLKLVSEITFSLLTLRSSPPRPSAASVLNSLQVTMASIALSLREASVARSTCSSENLTLRVMSTLLLRLRSWISSRVEMSSLQIWRQYFSHWKAVLISWMQSFSFTNSVFIALSLSASTMFTCFSTSSLNTMKNRCSLTSRQILVRVKLILCSGKPATFSLGKKSRSDCRILALSLCLILLRQNSPSRGSSVELSVKESSPYLVRKPLFMMWKTLRMAFWGLATWMRWRENSICSKGIFSVLLFIWIRMPRSTCSRLLPLQLTSISSLNYSWNLSLPTALEPTSRPGSRKMCISPICRRRMGMAISMTIWRCLAQRKRIMTLVMSMLQLSCSATQFMREGLRRIMDIHPMMLEITSSENFSSFFSTRTSKKVTSFLLSRVRMVARELAASKWSWLNSFRSAQRIAFLISQSILISPVRSMCTLRVRPMRVKSAMEASWTSQRPKLMRYILTSIKTSLKMSMPSIASSFSFLSSSSCIIFLLFSAFRTSAIFFISLSNRKLLITSSVMFSRTEIGTSLRMTSSLPFSPSSSFSSLAILPTTARQYFSVASSKLYPFLPFLMMFSPQSQKCCTQWKT